MRRALIAAVAATAGTSPAFAGGFHLKEQSPAGVGRAFAGEAALARDASSIFHNPAGMTRLGRGAVELGSHFLLVDSSQADLGSTRDGPFSGAVPAGGGDGGNPFDRLVPVPSAYGAFRLGQSKVWLGLGVSAPFGLKVDYDEGWFGRYDSLRSELKTINVQPSVAYALSDTVSVGAGLSFQWMRAELTNALPNLAPGQPDGLLQLKGRDMSIGWNIGMLLDRPGLRIGLHYRSRVSHDLQGSLAVTGLLGPLAGRNLKTEVTSPLTTPDIASAGIILHPNRPLRLLASANWYNWSNFREIRVRSQGSTILRSPQNYKDSWSASAGLELDLSRSVTARAGVMHDRTPTRDWFRTTRVPDGDRTWLTAGASTLVRPALSLNLSYAHVFVSSERIDRSETFYAETPASTQVRTRARGTGNVDMLTISTSARF